VQGFRERIGWPFGLRTPQVRFLSEGNVPFRLLSRWCNCLRVQKSDKSLDSTEELIEGDHLHPAAQLPAKELERTLLCDGGKFYAVANDHYTWRIENVKIIR
jgi:hypothetical protein